MFGTGQRISSHFQYLVTRRYRTIKKSKLKSPLEEGMISQRKESTQTFNPVCK